MVRPRSALAAKGSAPWRFEVLRQGAFADVTLILSNMRWAFEDVHPRYTFALATIRRGAEYGGEVALRAR